MGKMNDLAKSLIHFSSNSVMNGRTKITLDELVRIFPAGISINGMTFGHSSEFDCDYVAFSFVEDDTKFFYGATILKEFANNFLTEGFAGNVDVLNEAIKKEPLTVKVIKRKSKSGKTSYWLFEKIEKAPVYSNETEIVPDDLDNDELPF